LGLCLEELGPEGERLSGMRRRLLDGITAALPDVLLCGPEIGLPGLRLPGNLNVSFGSVDGEALLINMGDLAVSSGAACTSANPEPSHVLRALGLDDDRVRSSLRFGLGRFNTPDEVEFAISAVTGAVERLRGMGSLAP
jgi:cysteine desulfurase